MTNSEPAYIFPVKTISLVCAIIFIFATLGTAQTVLFGSQAIEAQHDSNALGTAEAFQTTATASGTLSTLAIYVDSTSTTGRLYAGLYTNNAGNPGTLLTQGNITTITAGAWNTISVPAVSVTSGTSYWIAVLGTTSGVIHFRDRKAGCTSEASAQTNLTSLPATWSAGPKYTDCPISGYGSTPAASSPILAVSPGTISFSAVQGGPNPASANLSVTNTGSSTLTYSIASDAVWLSATPSSGTAPQTVQVSANVAGLTSNTYTGHLTITSAGSQGSPATVTVTLTVTPPPPPNPILSVAPQTIAFNAVQGGANPSPTGVSVTNTGSGTLSFTASSDASWLGVSPASGSAPSNLQLTAAVGSLVAGTYTGHITVTASGVQGSPATITVTFTIASPPPPNLVVSPSTLTFSATQGGGDPSALGVNISNSGSGVLSFTATSDAAWLGVSPASGTAPQTLTVQPSIATLAPNTYTGHVTITAAGAQNSPSTVTVTLTVNPTAPPPPPSAIGDWLMINHDPARSGFASDESALSTSNVANLKLRWTLSVDGQVSAQPLYAGSIPIGSTIRDILVVATAGNSIYGLDANSGDTLWRRNFGSQTSNCVLAGGFGVFGAPLLDRSTLRAYAVSSDGSLRTISLVDGTDAAPVLSLITNSDTNKVWGGINRFGNKVYIASGSDGCDTPPWSGHIYQVDISGPNPVLSNSFNVVPGIAPPNNGGGIWGYGGVSLDTNTGNVYATTAADSAETFTPWSNRFMALDSNLNLLGAYVPSEPGTFPCSGAPCDLDFASTPTLFQPNGCSLLAAGGNKNGNLYLFNTPDLIANGSPSQILQLSTANDSLGSGGVGGVAAWWPQGNMLFVTDRGGANGIAGGVVGMRVTNACTLQVAWSAALGGAGQPNSDASLANGLVFAGAGNGGQVHAYDANTGTELWNSGTQNGALTFGAPMVARGKLYFGSWGGYGAGAGGSVYAFASDPFPGPVLGGNQAVETRLDSNPVGIAEAFPVTPTTSGTVAALRIYLDSSSTGTQIFAGLYSDANGHPGTLLTQANVNSPGAGKWVTVTMPTANVTAGTPYWIAILSTGSGTLFFRDRTVGPCTSESSAQNGLSRLPMTWTSGPVSNNCPLSGYIVGITPSQPTLVVTPSSLSLSAPQGQQAGGTLSASNAGGGTLSFAALVDSPWLSVSPTSGTTPQSLQVTADSTSLSPGNYTGFVTVSSNGSQGSPASVQVNFTVQQPPPPFPVLSASPLTFAFNGVQGGTNPPGTTVSVSNSGTGTLSFTAASDAAWLSVTPASANAPQTLQVNASLTGLTAGSYTGHISVTGATGVQNSPATVTVTLTVAPPVPPSLLLFGDTGIEIQRDSNALGSAEAFQTTAVASGPVGTMFFYLDSSSTVSKVAIGIYADNSGHPGTLLSQASSTALTAGTWNTVNVPAANINNGTKYWIAVLGTGTGSFYFRDKARGSCVSEASAQTNLTTLPASWSSGAVYSDCPVSAYGKTSP